jgi:hypothetical protein
MIESISMLIWVSSFYKQAFNYLSRYFELEAMTDFIFLLMCFLLIVTVQAMVGFIALFVFFLIFNVLQSMIDFISLLTCVLFMYESGIVVPNLCFMCMYKYGIFTPNVPVLCIHIFVCDVYNAWWRGTLSQLVMRMKKQLIGLPMEISRMRGESKLRVSPQNINQDEHISNTLHRLACLMHAIWNMHCEFLDRLANPYVPAAQEDEAEWEMQHFTHSLPVSKVSGG